MLTTVISSIKPTGGGDYTTLAAWEAAKRSNLVTANQIQIAEIHRGGNVGIVSISESYWTVDSTHYIHIRAATGEGHSGIFNSDTAYIAAAFAETPILVSVPYTKIGPGISIQVHQYSIGISLSQPANNCVIDGIIIRSSVSSTATGIKIYRCSDNIISNCIMHFGSDGTSIKHCINLSGSTVSASASIYNCTFHISGSGSACLYSYAVSGATTLLTSDNCYFAVSNGAVCYLPSPASSGTFYKGTHSATSNTEAYTVALQNIPFTTDNFVNVTTGLEDLHLKTTSVLKNRGADLSSYFTTDIDGETRDLPFDIGADGLPEDPYVAMDPFILGSGISNYVEAIKNDFGEDTDYTNTDYVNLVIKAIRRVNWRINTLFSYYPTVSGISPVPTEQQADIIVAQAECLLSKRMRSKAVSKGIMVKDGDSQIDTTAAFGGYKDLVDDNCQNLEKLIALYMSENCAGELITHGDQNTQVEEYHNGDANHTRDYSSPFDSDENMV